MNTTTAAPLTVTLSAEAGRVAVRFEGELLGTVKDGGHIVRNAERVIKAAGVIRTTGYNLDEDRNLVATAIRLERRP